LSDQQEVAVLEEMPHQDQELAQLDNVTSYQLPVVMDQQQPVERVVLPLREEQELEEGEVERRQVLLLTVEQQLSLVQVLQQLVVSPRAEPEPLEP
jgi:hypothetical protein